MVTSPLRALSFNVRYDTPDDGEDAWRDRRDLVATTVADAAPDVFGLQEPLAHQLDYLAGALDHEFLGVGRRDGDREGEFAPVGYDPARFEPVAGDTFWLSAAPERSGSLGWDADYPRIATWALLSDRAAGGRLLACNTHLDAAGREARREGARLLLDRLGGLAADHEPDRVVLTGDFNCRPGSAPHELVTAGDPGPELVDAREAATETAGPAGTFHRFDGDPDRRIDYVFVDPEWEVRHHETVTHSRGDRYPSDHFPVLAELT